MLLRSSNLLVPSSNIGEKIDFMNNKTFSKKILPTLNIFPVIFKSNACMNNIEIDRPVELKFLLYDFVKGNTL